MQSPYGTEEATTTASNAYHYVSNDPLNFTDPLGLCRVSDREIRADLAAYGVQFGSGGCSTAGNQRALACLAYLPGYYAPHNPDMVGGTTYQADWDAMGGWDPYIGVINDCVGGGMSPDSKAWEIAGDFHHLEIIFYGDELDRNCDPNNTACLAFEAAADAGAGALALFGLAGIGRPPSTGRPTIGHGCSFTAETEIAMADGSTRPISEVEIGDEVLATDPETGEQTAEVVTATFVHDDQVLDLILEGDGEVATTDDHPFWNATDGGWQEAQALDPGDQLLTDDGLRVTVEGLDWATARTDAAYNLTVTGPQTYFVDTGEQQVLVHNCSGMIGSGGTRTTSTTLLTNSNYHIDVENPNPGGRPGQLHLQDYRGNKYQYNFATGEFEGMPGRLSRLVARDPAVAGAISRGLRYLGM